MLRHNLLYACIEIRLQISIVLQTVNTHELLNFWICVPLLAVNFISSNVKKLVGEKFCHFSDKFVEKFVSTLARRIHRRIEYAPLAFNRVRSGRARQIGIT